MPSAKLKEFLNSRGIKYVSVQHSPAFTAAEIAASSHVSGRGFAKTVIVKIGGALAMVVLPANRKLVISDLRELLETDHVKLASEAEFQGAFPDCEIGAMPPFGNLYGMPIYVAAGLAAEPEIAFNACTHTEVIKMAYADFEALVHPEKVDLVTT